MVADDELAQTATAPASPSATQQRRAMLGRFRLDATLGEGGMGVVHAAFDPELERNVALKVLRDAGNPDGRARLLREARAMAKLSHPHVITVFEVGSADDQDFIAMELVDGETLGEWLRRTQAAPRAIISAFMAAGRGLAAAHAAGLVHRDFKPSNVLRSRGGKIVVTDFGLARDSGGSESAATGAKAGAIAGTGAGAIAGTPAYMAPEQWTGGMVGPATDVFAFCVALWEAFAGERPYRGSTIEEIRTGVLAGPAELAADAIPRPLRATLRRGMAVDPAQRWPSMTALLAVLDRYVGRRRRRIVAATSAIALAGVAVLVVALRREPAAACAPPALDPAVVWSPDRSATVRARDADAAALVDGDVATWRTLRARSCTAPPSVRSAKLACFDATLARLDAMVGAALADHGRLDADGISSGLVDPAMCDRAWPPRLAPITPELASAFALLRRAIAGDPAPTADALALADAVPPCAKTIALAARLASLDERALPANASEFLRDVAAIAEVAPQCEDDPIKTSAAITEPVLKGAPDPAQMEAALAPFPQDDLRGEIESTRARLARSAEQWDQATEASGRAVGLYGHRHRVHPQLVEVRAQIEGLLHRGRPGDIVQAQQLVARWLPIARGLGAKAMHFEEDALGLRWRLGDVADADADAVALRDRGGLTPFRFPFPSQPTIDVAGEVVDESGAPIANATVTAAQIMIGDSASAAAPLYTLDYEATLTSGDGTFAISGASGVVAAQAGEQRSSSVAVAPHVHLVARATSRLEGTVALGTTPATAVWVVARSEHKAPTTLVAPVLANGSFSLDGVSRGKLAIGIGMFGAYEIGGRVEHIVIDRERVTGIALAATQVRLQVIVRSQDVTPPDGALIWVFPKLDPGPHPTLAKLFQTKPLKSGIWAPRADLHHVADELAGKLQSDDMLATIPDRPDGELVVCAIAVAKQQLARATSLEAYGQAMGKLDLACTRVARDQSIVIIDVLPLRKLHD